MQATINTELNSSSKHLSYPKYQDASSKAFVWYFYINVPEGIPDRSVQKPRDSDNERGILTPIQNSLDGPSLKSLTPLSFIDKIANFSPFHTASQKRLNTSIGNSHKPPVNLKRTKYMTKTSHEAPATFISQKLDPTGVSDKKMAPNTESFSTPSEIPETPKIVKNTSKQFNLEKLFGPSLSRTATSDLPLTSQNSDVAVSREKNTGEGCNCRNTRCLKLYCECLRRGGICGSSCNCVGCENHADSSIRHDHIRNIERRNPLAFKQVGRIKQVLDGLPNKGCNCRRSHCLKNYCECHQFGAKCTDACRCLDCKNTEISALTSTNLEPAAQTKDRLENSEKNIFPISSLLSDGDS